LGACVSSRVPASSGVRFGDFELDLRTGELRRDGTILKLQPQPARVLVLLVSHAGEVVTRQDLAQQVWGSDTFVDFEQGLNYAIRQIRSALEDDPDHPRFLETLPKRGYRFIAPVENLPEAGRPEAETHPQDELASQNRPEEKPKHSRRPWLTVGGLAVALLIAGIVKQSSAGIRQGVLRARRFNRSQSCRWLICLPIRRRNTLPTALPTK
jgi:DNA-binding winged helix-turn-helix (wHTH) protein